MDTITEHSFRSIQLLYQHLIHIRRDAWSILFKEHPCNDSNCVPMVDLVNQLNVVQRRPDPGGNEVLPPDDADSFDGALLVGNYFTLLCDNATASYLCLNESQAANSTNATGVDSGGAELLADVIVMAVISVILGLMILITVIGNVFVIAAILLERNLHSVANYLIVSLAVADLMVACLVMPLGAVYEISKGWILGPELCDMWTSSDVLCCTASILHLVAIAVDRYWAVTYVDYIHTRNINRIGGMIVMIWSVAVVVSLAPQFGWKDPEYLDRINLQQRCLPSQDVAYQIFATCSTFYVPLLVILCLYWKIFQTARKRIHRNRARRPQTAPSEKSARPPMKSFLSKKRFRKMKSNKKSSAAEALVSSLVLVEGHSTASVEAPYDEEMCMENNERLSGETSGNAEAASSGAPDGGDVEAAVETTVLTISEGVALSTQAQQSQQTQNESPDKTSTNNGSASHQSHMSDMSKVTMLKEKEPVVVESAHKERAVKTPKEKKESLEAKRERKAAKTLAIITGAFVVCWLPFFIMALLMPLCGDACPINDVMASFFLWLGYFNSTLNPIIYTIFSPEFRQAFTRILCGAKHTRHLRLKGKLR